RSALAGREEVRPPRRAAEEDESAHLAAQLRDAPVGERRRLAGGAGNARPREHWDDADLHARRPHAVEGDAQAVPPAGLRPMTKDQCPTNDRGMSKGE